MSHPPTYAFSASALRTEVSVTLNHQMTTANGDIPIPPPPYELLGVITNSEWDERLHSLLTHLNRTTWSLWLRIYVLLGFLLSCFLPWPLIVLVQRSILGSDRVGSGFSAPFMVGGGAEGDFVVDDKYFEDVRDARIASGGILLGVWIVIWLPLLAYLAFQSHRLSVLLHSFTRTDSLKGTFQSLRWSLSRTRFLRRTSLLTIGLPSKLVEASSFNPNAYINQQLPPYVARLSMEKGSRGHARRRSGSRSSVASGGSLGSIGGRERPEERRRFDYGPMNMFGAPLVTRGAGPQLGGIRAPYRV